MNKTVVGFIISVIALGSIVAVIATNNSNKKDKSTSVATQKDDNNSNHDAKAPTSTSEIQAVDKVSIMDFAFSPEKITVKKGTTVTWTNNDSAKHTIKADSGTGPASNLLANGDTYTYTYNEVGSFGYHCEPHPYMKGTVEVTE